MHRLKSIFISLATLFWLSSSIYIISYGAENNVWHLGAILSSAIPILFLARLFIIKTPRTQRNLIFLLTLIIAGLLDEIIWVKESDPIMIGLSSMSVFLWLMYIFWYSRFPGRDSKTLVVGKIMPDFSFKDVNGDEIVLDGKGDKKRIYLFYRGNWCPLCMAQVEEISKEYNELDAMGVEVALISPQPHSFSVKLAKKMNVPIRFLSDTEGKVAKELEIFVEGGTPLGMELLGFSSDAVMPTVVITDEKNKILFVDQTDNYRVRPEPRTFFKILNENS